MKTLTRKNPKPASAEVNEYVEAVADVLRHAEQLGRSLERLNRVRPESVEAVHKNAEELLKDAEGLAWILDMSADVISCNAPAASVIASGTIDDLLDEMRKGVVS